MFEGKYGKENMDALDTLWINPIGSLAYTTALTILLNYMQSTIKGRGISEHYYTADKSIFIHFFTELKQVVEALATPSGQIFAETGQYEIKYRVGPQLSSAEMVARPAIHSLVYQTLLHIHE